MNKELKILLIKRDLTKEIIATAVERTPNMIYLVLSNKVKGEATRRAIAEYLGMPYADLCALIEGKPVKKSRKKKAA